MPAPLAIDREQVRMLVQSVGVREAARKCNLSENTVLSWCNRGGWLDHVKPENAPKPPLSMQATVAIGAISPADALRDTLAEHGRATKLAGMEYAKLVTEHARESARTEPERALEAAGNVKAALQAAAIAGDWQQGPQIGVAISLGRSDVG